MSRMITRIFTESDAVYYYDEENQRIMRRRISDNPNELRRDDQWINLKQPIGEIVIGQSMELHLECLKPGFEEHGFTFRKTTPVQDFDSYPYEEEEIA